MQDIVSTGTGAVLLSKACELTSIICTIYHAWNNRQLVYGSNASTEGGCQPMSRPEGQQLAVGYQPGTEAKGNAEGQFLLQMHAH